jgi:hypothetical protein
MKKGTKIVIGVVMTVLLIIGLIIGLVVTELYYELFYQSKINRQNWEQTGIDGKEFGKSTDQNGCLEKGFSPEPSHAYSDYNFLFVSECLNSSQPSPNFCDGVPPWLQSESRIWEAKQCEKVPNKDACHETMSAKLSYCDNEKRKKK